MVVSVGVLSGSFAFVVAELAYIVNKLPQVASKTIDAGFVTAGILHCLYIGTNLHDEYIICMQLYTPVL